MKTILAAAIAAFAIATPAQAQQCMANGWCHAYTHKGTTTYLKVIKKQWPYVVYQDQTTGGKYPGTETAVMDCNRAKNRWANTTTWQDILPGTNGEVTMQIVCR